MMRVRCLIFCLACVFPLGCGGKSGPTEAEMRGQEARSLSGPRQMRDFLARAQSELASRIGGGAITESPVAVAAAIRGGKPAGGYQGRPAVWTGAVMDFDANAGKIQLRCPDGDDVVTVSLALQPAARGNMSDLDKALGVVFCGVLRSATESSHELVDGFVFAAWLESGKGEEYAEVAEAAVGGLRAR